MENDDASNGAVEAKESGAREGKAQTGSARDLGIWFSRSTRTNEHLVGTRVGLIRARMAKRRPESQRWDGELYDAMDAVPWWIDGQHITPESGSEFTSGCKACDEERSAVKRRDRSFNPTTESNERQADFRVRLCEMKMLSAGDASSLSPVLNRTSGIVPVLSGPRAIVEPSSSNSEVVVQPMAVDFDIF